MQDVVCLTEAGAILGIDRQTVSDMMRAIKLPFKPCFGTGPRKGASRQDIAIMRERLRPVGELESVLA